MAVFGVPIIDIGALHLDFYLFGEFVCVAFSLPSFLVPGN
jgi:hypothetical protein